MSWRPDVHIGAAVGVRFYELDGPPPPMWREMVPNTDRRWWQFWKPKMRTVYCSKCVMIELPSD